MKPTYYYWAAVILAIVALVLIARHVYASEHGDTVVPVSTGDRATIQAEGEKVSRETKWAFPATAARAQPWVASAPQGAK
jgi:hypothetical protein